MYIECGFSHDFLNKLHNLGARPIYNGKLTYASTRDFKWPYIAFTFYIPFQGKIVNIAKVLEREKQLVKNPNV